MNHSSYISVQFMGWLGGICLLILFNRCVEPIEVDIPIQEPLLVVDGLITDQPGPYYVKISLSSQLNELALNPVTGATVIIEEEGGPRVKLYEQSDGTYLTNPTSLQGQVGKNYRLEISLDSDRNYLSEWNTLKASPAIEKLYYEFYDIPSERFDEHGINIYLDTRDPAGKTVFYRWEWEDTWIHRAPFATGLTFLGNDQVGQGPINDICYNSSRSTSIYLGSSINNTQDIISQFPIKDVSGNNSKLLYRYSFLAKQYALDEGEFLFWKALQEANENTGTLFEKQPQSTTGNIFRIENESEPVLGYFSVSGYSQKRIFISRSELPMDANIGDVYLENCFASIDTLFKGIDTEEDVFKKIERGQVFYDFYKIIAIAGWMFTTKECADCTEAGGTTIKPNFWE